MGQKVKETESLIEKLISYAREDEEPVSASCDDGGETAPTIIVGRDEDKQRILDVLLSSPRPRVVVLPILGPPGVGKTALARLVFHDAGFHHHSKVWVHVPQQQFHDDPPSDELGSHMVSELSKIARYSYEDSGHYNDTEKRLEELSSKHLPAAGIDKVLLVLDGLLVSYTSFVGELNSMLDAVFTSGEWTVIITTCIRPVAYGMRLYTEPHRLRPLSDNSCLEIIKRQARGLMEERVLETAAEQCGGLPLRALAIGSRLRRCMTTTPQECLSSSAQAQLIRDSVLSSLKASYRLMDPFNRLCFAYCAIYPKGHSTIAKHDLALQWRILGFSGGGYFDIGADYPWELLDISFLQPAALASKGGGDDDRIAESFTMPGPVHDFARAVLGNDLIVVDGTNGMASANSNARYALITDPNVTASDLSRRLPARLWALHVHGCDDVKLTAGAFSVLKYLRVLDLSGCSLQKLPNWVGQLKLLAYLSAPGIQDRTIPSIARLTRLSYLNLRNASKLLRLKFAGVYELRHLDLSGCSGLVKLQVDYGYWLEHLDLSDCTGLAELPESFIMSLNELNHLDLSGCSCLGGILEALQSASRKLQYLNLSHRCGYSMEDWFHLKGLDAVLPKLKQLQFLGLSSCLDPICYALPPEESQKYIECITGLTDLQHLDLSQNKFLLELPGNIGRLKQLRVMDLSGCFRLQRLPESIGELTELRTLGISGCPQLNPLPEDTQKQLARLPFLQGHEACRPFQAASYQEQRSPSATEAHKPQGSASTAQDTTVQLIHQVSPAEPEITEIITDEN